MKYRDPITVDFKEIYIKVSDTLPVGAICQYGGSTAPSGYLMCNGQSVSRLDYAELFAAIGTTFGSGDGLTTFNVPNFNGRVPVGLDGTDTDFDTLGETGGSKYLQEHNHNLKLYSGTLTAPPSSGIVAWGNLSGATEGTTTPPTNYQWYDSSIQNAGTGDSGNLQPYLVTNFIIKASKKVALDKGEVVNVASESTEDAYSCDYVNKNITDVVDITSLITKTADVGTVYNMYAYKKGNRCYLDATIDFYNGNIFTLDSSITPSFGGTYIAMNYDANNTKIATTTTIPNNTNIAATTFGTALAYLSLHTEWEI